MMIVLYVLLILSAIAILVFCSSRYGIFTPISIFSTLNLIMGVGSLALLDLDQVADRVHAGIIFCTLLIYSASVFVLVSSSRSKRPGAGKGAWGRGNAVSVTPQGAGVLAVFLLSVAVTIVYYYAVGASAFVAGLMSFIRHEEVGDIATMRLDAYSGQRYLFPGYVNQFKNALLPALFVVLATAWLRRRKYLLVFAVLPVVLLALLGTGQRGAFVIALLTAITYSYWLQGARLGKLGRRLMTGGLVLFVLATIATGRTEVADSAADSIANGVQGMFKRVFEDQQISSVYGFRYIYSLPTAHGSEWFQGIIGLLPGVKGSTLSNEIFATLYGSTRGTSPPSLWGSVYHNFGLLGVAILPVVLAFVHVAVTELGTSSPQPNTLSLVGMSGVFVVLGSWVAGSPESMLNTGLAVYVLIWIIGHRKAQEGQVVHMSVRSSIERPSRSQCSARRRTRGRRPESGEVGTVGGRSCRR